MSSHPLGHWVWSTLLNSTFNGVIPAVTPSPFSINLFWFFFIRFSSKSHTLTVLHITWKKNETSQRTYKRKQNIINYIPWPHMPLLLLPKSVFLFHNKICPCLLPSILLNFSHENCFFCHGRYLLTSNIWNAAFDFCLNSALHLKTISKPHLPGRILVQQPLTNPFLVHCHPCISTLLTVHLSLLDRLLW